MTEENHELENAAQTVGVAPGIVADKVDEHTPAPVTPPVVEAVPNPPTPQDGMSELKEIVTGLGTAVATLTATVAALQPKDSSPASLPWTHRGGNHDGNGNNGDG